MRPTKILGACLLALVVAEVQLPFAAHAQTASELAYFEAEEYRVPEGAGTVNVPIRRDSATSEAVVTITTRALEAKAGKDFQPVETQLQFSVGDTGPKAVQVTILKDDAGEDEESVLLIMADAAGRTIDVTEIVIVSDQPEEDASGPGPHDQGDSAGSGSESIPNGSATNSQNRPVGRPGLVAPGGEPDVAAQTPVIPVIPVINLASPQQAPVDYDDGRMGQKDRAGGRTVGNDRPTGAVRIMAVILALIGSLLLLLRVFRPSH